MARRNIDSRLTLDATDFQSKMALMAKEMNKLGKKMQSVGKSMSTYITLPIAALGAMSIKSASDVEESMNKVDVAFKESSQEVKDWSKTTLKAFGIASGTALDMAALFGDMATGMGINTTEAAKMSKSLVGLAGDLASFKNISIDVAQTALKSIFTGETESLKNLGIVMTQANLQAFALTQGITKNIQAMSESEKVNLRYAFVLARTTNAQGDFTRTGGGAANQMRIFQESLKEIAATMGAYILPLFTKIVTKVNEWISRFNELSDGTKKTIIIVAGIAAAIGPLLLIAGKLITTVGLLSKTLVTLRTTALLTTASIGPLVAVFVALGAAMAYINHKEGKRKEKLDILTKKSTDELKTSVQSLTDEYSKLGKEITELEKKENKRTKNVTISPEGVSMVEMGESLEQQSLRTKKEKLKVLQEEIGLTKKALEIVKETTVETKVFDTTIKDLKETIKGDGKPLIDQKDLGLEQIKEKVDFRLPNSQLIEMTDAVKALNTVLSETPKKLLAAEEMAKAFGTETELAAEKQNILEGAIKQLIDAGFSAMSPQVQALITQMEGLNEVQQNVIDVSDSLTSAVQNSLQSTVEDMATLTGELIAGVDTQLTFLDVLMKNMAGFMKAFGSALVAVGVAKIAFENLKISGIGAVIAGFALIAAATAVQSKLAAPKLAQGGLAYGPTMALVGDNKGAGVDPEVIAPLSKLKGIMGGGGSQTIIPDVRISGQDLLIVFNNAEKRLNRIK